MKRVIPFLPWLGALLLVAVVLLCFEADLLWKIQQYNLFLDTPHFFREQMLVPGGFLSYVSCYFTQFFFHPWLGVLVLCGWWLLLMWLIKRTFRIADDWAILTLIPIAFLLIADIGLGYWHYFMKLRGYFFVPTIGTAAAVTMLWAFRALPKSWLRVAWLITATIVGYPLFGIYALASVMLMGIWAWRLAGERTQSALQTFVALLCIVAVPLVCYRYIYYQTYLNDLWIAALPITNVLRAFPAYHLPYYVVGGFFLLMVVFYQVSLPAKPFYRWSLQSVLVIALIASVWHWWYKDEDFHHELVMQHCIEQTDWEGVIDEGRKQGDEEPTRSIVMMHNLALSRLGRQPDEMLDFPWGRKLGDPNVPYDMLNQVFSRTIFYQYGLLNDAHRTCMENGVEYGWKVETLQYLARCSILNGEKAAAQKILDKLRHTKYHSEWADSMQLLLDNPKLIAESREMAPIRHMMQYKNAFAIDEGKAEKFVMNVLAYQDSNDPYFQEQAVLAALLKKRPQLFWARFNRYIHLCKGQPIPRIFQEAAYLFGKTGEGPNPELLPIDESVKKSYDAFTKQSVQYKGQSVDIVRTALHPFFGNSYYFYYNFWQDMN